MIVTEISVSNWRNLARQKVQLGPKLNIFAGDNAQGKTNLVESVCLCCLGKSPRTDKDRDLICWGKDRAFVRVRYVCRLGEGEIAVTLNAGAKKQITINGISISRTGELLGYLNCVYFSPDEIRIIDQTPSERRRFMDIDLCQTDKTYFYSLSRFNKALTQRNNLLKQAKNIDELRDMIFVWNEQLAEAGARIILKRRAFCNRLKGVAAETHASLTDGTERLSTEYVTQIQGETLDQLTENYRSRLDSALDKDFALRYTSTGCQRDDVAIKINDTDVRTYGSRGQLRTAALSLKLSELKIFRDIIGEYPILILDDVLSELDPVRQQRLLRFDNELQILLTSAYNIPCSLAGNDCKYFTVKEGICSQK